MRLTELQPRWIHEQKVFAFLCPHCRKTWLTCKSVPMSQKEQREVIERAFGEEIAGNIVGCRPEMSWSFSSLDFETMTVGPSLDASESGHWHGHIANGAIT